MAGQKKLTGRGGLPLFLMAMFAIGILILADNLEFASAVSYQVFTPASLSGLTCQNIAATSSYLWLACSSNNTLYAFTHAGTLVASTSVATIGAIEVYDFSGNVVLVTSSSTLHKYVYNSAANALQSVASVSYATCTTSTLRMDADKYAWITCGAQDTVKVVNALTMTVHFSSASLNGGSHTCDSPSSATNDPVNDVVIIACAASTTKFVLYDSTGEDVTTADAQTSVVLADADSLALNIGGKSAMLCRTSSAACAVYNYTATTFTLVKSGIGTDYSSSSARFGGSVASAGNTFVFEEGTIDAVVFVDAETGDIHLKASQAGDVSGNMGRSTFYSSTLMYTSSGTGTLGKYVLWDLTGMTGSGATVIDNEGCSAGETAVDIDSSASVVEIFCLPDDDGDGIPDFNWNNLPPSGAENVGESLPGFIGVFGFDSETSNLIAAIITHIVVVFGPAGIFFWATKTSPPMFIWVAFLVFGGGLSAVIGFMPLIYFFIEVALVVGSVAALIKAGVIGT